MLPRYSCAMSATPSAFRSPLSPMGAGGRDGSDLAVGVGRFLGENAHYDGRDVVVAAVDVRFLDECVDDPLGFRARDQQLLDSPVIDHSRQPVTGEEKRVANPR